MDKQLGGGGQTGEYTQIKSIIRQLDGLKDTINRCSRVGRQVRYMRQWHVDEYDQVDEWAEAYSRQTGRSIDTEMRKHRNLCEKIDR